MKIALDTGCLNAKKQCEVLNELERLDEEGKITLITSTVLEKEQGKIKNEEWKKKYLKIINEKSKVPETFRLSLSGLGNAVFGDAEVHDKVVEIFGDDDEILSNNDFDRWILETAIVHDCDYFVTLNTNHFIDNGRQEEIEELGIKVRTPTEDFLEEIE